jgi:hypothetical protein
VFFILPVFIKKLSVYRVMVPLFDERDSLAPPSYPGHAVLLKTITYVFYIHDTVVVVSLCVGSDQ